MEDASIMHHHNLVHPSESSTLSEELKLKKSDDISVDNPTLPGSLEELENKLAKTSLTEHDKQVKEEASK